MYAKGKKKGWLQPPFYAAAAVATPPAATYQSNASTTQTSGSNGTSSPWTASGVNIGSAFSSRRVIVFAWGGAGNTDVASATIGGIAATTPIVVGTNVRISVFSAVVPTGTTANIVLTMTGAFYGSSGIQVFTCDDSLLTSATPVMTGANASGVTTISGSVTTLAGGFVVELLTADSNTYRAPVAISASSPTQVIDLTDDRSTTLAHVNGASAGTATVTYTWDSGTSVNPTLAMAAFR